MRVTTLTIYDEHGQSISGKVFFYDNVGTEIGLSAVPVGGAEITEPTGTARLKVEAPGYQDAWVFDDIFTYSTWHEELIPQPKSQIIVIGVVALALYAVFRIFKL